jgi:hypothetical protein
MPNARKMTDATEKPPPPASQQKDDDPPAAAASKYRSLFSIHGSPLAECEAWLDQQQKGATISVSKKVGWMVPFVNVYTQGHTEKSLREEMKRRGCPIPRVSTQDAERCGRVFLLCAAYFDFALEEKGIKTVIDDEKPPWKLVHDLVDAR